jgi:hypothetical protein
MSSTPAQRRKAIRMAEINRLLQAALRAAMDIDTQPLPKPPENG